MEDCRIPCAPPIFRKSVILFGVMLLTLGILMGTTRVKGKMKLPIETIKETLRCGPFRSIA